MGTGISFIIENHKNEFFSFLKAVAVNSKKMLLTGELMQIYESLPEKPSSNKDVAMFIEKIQETVSLDHTILMDVRERIAYTTFYRINLEEYFIEEIDAKEFLANKEAQAFPYESNFLLNLNFKPFYDSSPSVRDTKHIGSGVEYLNRYLSSQMFNNIDKWKKILFDFIRLHKHNNEQLILNDRINNPAHLTQQIDIAINKLSEIRGPVSYAEIKYMLLDLGFEKGLGKDSQTILNNLKLLDQLLNSPDHESLAKFISAIPMIFKIAIVSTHGYFAQEGVLGMPDTGGQVVYILDQVKALEKTLTESIKQSGLEILPKIVVLTRLIPNAGKTTCNKRIEKIHGTKNSWILRVPFREHNKHVTENWISRFEIYPYLEEFAEDAYTGLLAEFGGRPDLIIGNYSDGNLVTYLLAKSFNVTQCCIAHALEKSKYLYSALYWKDLEQYYHFSLQFTADLIAINSSDFLISSSFQEIAGTENSAGQYESYKHFTMPGLYRVEDGVNPYDVKFNIVSPGVNEKVYFPYTRTESRITETKRTLTDLLFNNIEDEDTVGTLESPDKTPIFSMARLDRIKNLTCLVECFGESEELQSNSNLIIVAGKIDESKTTDNEEKEQIRQMHELIKHYKIGKKIRWIGKLFRKDEGGEVYRIIADRKGIFVQPALFEGFGLTVLEAMVSGLPVFATKYGGPLEIIQNNISGFHIDPVNKNETIEKLLNFLKEIKENPKAWDQISKNSIKRVNERYNWKLYSQRLLMLAKLYGFWKFSTNLDHKDMEAYLDIFYHTMFRPRANALLNEHMKR